MTEKKFDPSRPIDEYFNNYLKADSFDGGDEILTITKVDSAMVFNEKTNGLEEKPILHFQERNQPMVLNKTKANAIKKLTGKKIPNEWVGVQIKVGKGKTPAFGKITDAIIIRDEKITAASTEKATTPQLKAILDMVDAGAINQQKLLQFYKIEQLNQLTRQQAKEIILSKTGEVIE